MLLILKAQLRSYFIDSFGVIENTSLCFINQFRLYIIQRGIARFLFDQVAEVICRKMQFLSAIRHGWKPQHKGVVRFKIVVQQLLKPHQDIAINIAACNKLAVIKPLAVI